MTDPARSRADETCERHDVDASETKTISEIVHACESDERGGERTVGFGDYVCLGDYLHMRTADRYITLAERADYIFVHNNMGGVSIAGARIGVDMLDHKRTLIIDGYCASACADYLFPAAERVIFIGPPSRSFLAWHGSPDSDGLRANVTPENHQKALEAHHDFLQRFRPARREALSRLMDVPRDGLSAIEERKRGKTWTYTDDELCRRFGFGNMTRLAAEDVETHD